MTRWEPLPDGMSENARRLAVQLRRMKDRSGLSVPTIAVRTALSTEAWEAYLNGVRVPPRDAVEALGQLCGADYDRLGALWELADRGGGTHVPHPDPLDPLSAAEGLPRLPWWRRMRKPVFVGFTGLALGAVLGLLILAGMTGEGGLGPKQADGDGSDGSATAAPSAASSARPGSQRPRTLSAAPAGASSGAAQAVGTDAASTAPVHATASSTPPSTAPATATAPAATASASASASASATPSASASASASATSDGGLCLGVLILNVCIGG